MHNVPTSVAINMLTVAINAYAMRTSFVLKSIPLTCPIDVVGTKYDYDARLMIVIGTAVNCCRSVVVLATIFELLRMVVVVL